MSSIGTADLKLPNGLVRRKVDVCHDGGIYVSGSVLTAAIEAMGGRWSQSPNWLSGWGPIPYIVDDRLGVIEDLEDPDWGCTEIRYPLDDLPFTVLVENENWD